MPEVLAYFIAWTCCGTWLHGDQRRSVVGKNRLLEPYADPNPALEAYSKSVLRDTPMVLNHEMR